MKRDKRFKIVLTTIFLNVDIYKVYICEDERVGEMKQICALLILIWAAQNHGSYG